MKVTLINATKGILADDISDFRNQLNESIEYEEVEWFQKDINAETWLVILITALVTHYAEPLLKKFDSAIMSFVRNVHKKKAKYYIALCMQYNGSLYKIQVESWDKSISELIKRLPEIEIALHVYLTTNAEIKKIRELDGRDRFSIENEDEAAMANEICTFIFDEENNKFIT